MAPQATPITAPDDVDEAIWWVLITAPRNIDYMKIVDALLDQRLELMSAQQGQDAHQSEHRQTRTDRPAWNSTGPHLST